MPAPCSPQPPPTFPTYLTRPGPFRRRKPSTSSSSISEGTSSSPSTSSPGSGPVQTPLLHHPVLDHLVDASSRHQAHAEPLPPPFLSHPATPRLRCARCLADLAHTTQIVSRGFTGRHGRAYLVAPSAACSFGRHGSDPDLDCRHHRTQRQKALHLPNTIVHSAVPRQLATGLHTVGDMSCALCGTVLGWKYFAAENEAQRYKVGKFILETRRVVTWGEWAGDDGGYDDDEEEEEEEEQEEEVGGCEYGDRRGMTMMMTTGRGGPVGRIGGDQRARLGKKGRGSSVEVGGEEEEEKEGESEERLLPSVEFESLDEDECEDLFMGVWTAQTALDRRMRKRRGTRQWGRYPR